MPNLQEKPHVVLVPSAGMGHLIPFSRLAVSLSNISQVSLVSVLPTVSSAESNLLSHLFATYPQINPVSFELPMFDSPAYPNADPFFLRFERINRSVSDLLAHLLSNSVARISCFVIDITLSSSFLPLVKSLGIPCYILFTSSASMLSFCAYFPTFYDSNPAGSIGDVPIPGLRTVPVKSIPKALHNPKHVFTSLFIKNGRDLIKSDGILLNTFDSFERETLMALRSQPGFPPVISIGPLVPIKSTLNSQTASLFSWLNNRKENSVVYVSFGSRTSMSREQIRELALGLESSGCMFIWVVKTKIVDKEEGEMELEELLGEGFLERVKERGLVIKEWVNQEEVLEHKAIGGFISHCGWNSVMEAAINGVRVLAWPRGGDQRLNAGVVARSGLGIWPEDWSWEGDEKLVTATNIRQMVKKLMSDECLLKSAQMIGEQARRAVEAGGRSTEGLVEIVGKLED